MSSGRCIERLYRTLAWPEEETTVKEWLKPQVEGAQAPVEVTSYLPAELDRA